MSDDPNPCRAIGCSRCCENIRIPLTESEMASLVRAGTDLSLVDPGLRAPEKFLYEIKGSCGNLREGACVVHGTAGQPEACRRFQKDGEKCMSLRSRR